MKTKIIVFGLLVLVSNNAAADILDFSFFDTFFDNVGNFFTTIIDAINGFIEFFSNDLRQWIVEIFGYLYGLIVKAFIHTALLFMDIGAEVMVNLLETESITSRLGPLWEALPSDIKMVMGVLNIPNIMTTLITAHITKLIMKSVAAFGG